jgi:hypothetical protein
LDFTKNRGRGVPPSLQVAKREYASLQGLGEKYFAAADHEFVVFLHASMSAMLISFVILSTLGIGSGFFPALKASRLNPIEAPIGKNMVTFCSGDPVEDSSTPEIILDSSAIHYGGQSIRQA